MRLLVTLFIFCFSILCAKSQPKAEDYFEWAEEKFMFEDTTGAIEALNSALNLHPLFYEAYLMRGKIYFDLKEYGKAREDIDFTFRLRDTVADAYYYRGRLRARNKEPRGAMLDFHKAIELDSVRPDYYLARAQHLEEMEADSNLIMSNYNRVLELDSNNTYALNSVGIRYIDKDMTEQGLRLINKARRIDPDDELSRYYLAIYYFNLKDYKRCEAYIAEVLNRNPQSYDAYFVRMQLYVIQDKFKEALDDVNRMIEIDSNNASAYRARALLHRRDRRINLALEDFDKAISLAPSKCAYYINKAWYLKALGRQNEAIELLNISLQYCPLNGEVFRIRGLCNHDNRQFQSACDDLRQAASLGDPYAHSLIKEYCKRYPAQE
jgi:tetratricopeptide (TPR) repeat protein